MNSPESNLSPDLDRRMTVEIVGALNRLHALQSAEAEITERLFQALQLRLDDLEERVSAIEESRRNHSP